MRGELRSPWLIAHRNSVGFSLSNLRTPGSAHSHKMTSADILIAVFTALADSLLSLQDTQWINIIG